MTPIDFQNDERFSIAPPWIVERLVDVPFFSEGDNDSQSFHAVIVMKGGEKVGVSVYGRRWIKLNTEDLQTVSEILGVISSPDISNSTLADSGDEFDGHQLRAEKENTMNSEDEDRTTQTESVEGQILAVNAAECGGEKFVLLTVRMTPNSFEVTEIRVPLHQAVQRLQGDIGDLLERSPLFMEEC